MLNFRKIILKPVITEKSTMLRERANKFVFEVNPRANKNQIKDAIEQFFNVKVRKINTCNVRGKMKTRFTRGGRFSGRLPDRKKAIVTLARGDSIDIIDQV
ncbi:MAG: 50S ribosomal protein L23 [Candidatus Latescibacteria bacterium]|nr:50S ribosomal protein L23 [Candidatus Latescibacterota bacterium]